ncbi:hypothetical protein ACODT3_40910 [Streptomyces sp. 4.24]|uniref:hypothetical protein n=1 Tax=Streptomyces tritrimontium TaxID=3406573 RepID=UPI003BB60E5A
MTDGQSAGWDPADSGPYPVAPRVPPPRPEYPPAGVPDDVADGYESSYPYSPATPDGYSYEGQPAYTPAPEPAAEVDWWRTADPREDWAGPEQGPGHEVREAAWEIGVTIGEAVAAHIPAPAPTAAEQGWRGLDLAWLGLKYNIPAIGIALLVTWRGQSGVASMTGYIAENGFFAPLGAVLLVGLLFGAVMLLPLGDWLAALLAQILRGLAHLTVRAWRARYIGYVLRLLVAVAAWAFVIAVVRLAGGAVLNWLTGA